MMRVFLQHTYNSFLLLILSSILTCCIYDSLDDCDPDGPAPAGEYIISFPFIYEYNMSFTDRFSHEVEVVDLFVFNEENNLYKIIEIDTENMAEQTVSFELPAGKYTAVAWGFDSDDEDVLSRNNIAYSNDGSKETFLLSLNCVADGELTKVDPGNLFHAINTFSVEEKDTTVPMDMVKNTKFLRVRMKGLTEDDRMAAPDIFYTRVESDNSMISHDNSIYPSGTVSYIPRYYQDGEDVVAEFHLLRMIADDNDTKVVLNPRDTYPRIIGLERPIVPEILNQMNRVRGDTEMTFAEYIDRSDEFELIFGMQYETDENGNIVIRVLPWDQITQPGEL